MSYDGIPLGGYNLTTGIDQETTTDPSGTDRLFTLFRIRVSGIINTDLIPALTSEPPAATMKRLEHRLLSHRKRLIYTAPDGTEFLNTDRDDANGPKPISCTITQVTPATWTIDYVVEARLSECVENIQGRAWLAHRWSEVVSFDELWRTTKTRSGFLILSGRSDADPDGWRGLITPTVDPGFRRERAEYSLDETGLLVKYTFVDRELMRPPPLPAVRVTGRRGESTPQAGGVRLGHINLRLEGPKGVPPKELLNAGVRIAVSTALASGIVRNEKSNRMLITGGIDEILDDDQNAIELSLRWKMRPLGGREKGSVDQTVELTGKGIAGLFFGLFGLPGAILGGVTAFGGVPPTPNAQGRDTAALPLGIAGWVGQPLPGSDPTRGIGPPTRGTADFVKLVAAALGDPCGQDVELRGGGQDAELRAGDNLLVGTTPGGAAVLVNTSANLLADDEAALFAEDSTPCVYEYYRVTSAYTDDPGVCMIASTKEGEESAPVRLHAGSARLEVTWSVSRIGGPPVVPAPQSHDPNFVYLGGTGVVENVELSGDGVSVVYKLSGLYRYGARRRCDVDMVAPLAPFLKETVAPESRKAIGILATDVIFYPGAGGELTNPWCGKGVQLVSRMGTAELRGGPQVNP